MDLESRERSNLDLSFLTACLLLGPQFLCQSSKVRSGQNGEFGPIQCGYVITLLQIFALGCCYGLVAPPQGDTSLKGTFPSFFWAGPNHSD